MRRLIDSPLHVEPHLVGPPLASPGRRVTAFAIHAIHLRTPRPLTGSAAATLFLQVTDRP